MVNYQYSVKFLLIKNSLIAAPATRLSVQFMQPAAKWTKWRCHKQRTEQTRTHTQAKHTYLHGTDKGKRLLQPELHGATRTFTNWLTQQPLLLSLRCSTLLFLSLSLSLSLVNFPWPEAPLQTLRYTARTTNFARAARRFLQHLGSKDSTRTTCMSLSGCRPNVKEQQPDNAATHARTRTICTSLARVSLPFMLVHRAQAIALCSSLDF